MKSSLITLGLLLAVPVFATETPAPVTVEVDAYLKLVSEYEKLQVEYKAKFDAAGLSERRELRDGHPAKNMWFAFEALGQSGDGRAYLWMISHARDSGLKKRQARELKSSLYERVFTVHVKDPWLVDALGSLMQDSLDISEEEVERHLRSAGEKSPFEMIKAISMMRLGELMSFSDDEERKQKGMEMIATYEAKYISEGAVAIDFDAKTIDGHTFKLSDYRGKTVLVDFYGFW